MKVKELINMISGNIEFYVDDHDIINNIYTPETIDQERLNDNVDYITVSPDGLLVIGTNESE